LRQRPRAVVYCPAQCPGLLKGRILYQL
jgi:hypothetical protein